MKATKAPPRLYVMLTKVDGEEFIDGDDDVYFTRQRAIEGAQHARVQTPKYSGETFRVAVYRGVARG